MHPRPQAASLPIPTPEPAEIHGWFLRVKLDGGPHAFVSIKDISAITTYVCNQKPVPNKSCIWIGDIHWITRHPSEELVELLKREVPLEQR